MRTFSVSIVTQSFFGQTSSDPSPMYAEDLSEQNDTLFEEVSYIVLFQEYVDHGTREKKKIFF